MITKVEEALLQHTKIRYPGEHIDLIVIPNFPLLGRAIALRFIEWLCSHPEGVASLPTGKTPEHFIKETSRFLSTWNTKETRESLSAYGIEGKKPSLKGLTFVQMDDFFPIGPNRENSFYHYVKKYYLQTLGFGEALLINTEEIIPEMNLEKMWTDEKVDLELRYRHPKTQRERQQQSIIKRIDEWCMHYENRIREKGGIGFFLGGIGPDGHIAFNIRGSDFHSTTRLTEINYETQAAAAQDLGGIEIAKRRLVITIGLATITFNPETIAIIIAAGTAKAPMVAQAVQSPPSIEYPATALQVLPHARFYVTKGAAEALRSRKVEATQKSTLLSDAMVERIVYDIALREQKPIISLTKEDFHRYEEGRHMLAQHAGIKNITKKVYDHLVAKLSRGMQPSTHTRYLHTEPHHDDIMLAYLPFVVRNIREASNFHHFVTLTSGFTAVTNNYISSLCERLIQVLQNTDYAFSSQYPQKHFHTHSHDILNTEVWHYLDGLAQNSTYEQERGTLGRFLRNVTTVYKLQTFEELIPTLKALKKYCHTHYPGTKDTEEVQQLKGLCRQWESACLWGYFGWESRNLDNMNLGFYKGETFNENPTMDRDAQPILDLLRRIRPHRITLAFDPEGSGPDTHYKVLQALSEAIHLYEEEAKETLEIIGYRNIWSRFHPSEVNIFVPVSLNMFSLQRESFMSTYLSQKDASFPSYEYEGPFSDLAQQIQNQQYRNMKICLGEAFFYEHTSALIRATRGLVYLKSMTADELYRYSRSLRKNVESGE